MRYLFILLALSGCTTTQLTTSCERAKQYIVAAELAIARLKAVCDNVATENDVASEPE